jgi:DNA-binding NtrC family response regulator
VHARGRSRPNTRRTTRSRAHPHKRPGNDRQLKNAIERAAVLALGDRIEIDDLPDELRRSPVAAASPSQAVQLSSATPYSTPHDVVVSLLPFRERLKYHEAGLIRGALAQADGNRTHAAQLLRMPLRTFMKRLKQYRID